MGAVEVRQWIKKKLDDLPVNWKILDVGAGQCQYKQDCGHLIYESQDSCEYSGIDEGKWDFSKIDIISDICYIPRDDETYNAILCTDVLEHIFDPMAAMREMVRLLKVGGLMIIVTPFGCLAHQEPFFFNAGLHKNWYIKAAEIFGLDVVEMRQDGNWFTQIKQEIERIPSGQFLKYTGYSPTETELQAVASVIRLFANMNYQDAGSDKETVGSYNVMLQKVHPYHG